MAHRRTSTHSSRSHPAHQAHGGHRVHTTNLIVGLIIGLGSLATYLIAGGVLGIGVFLALTNPETYDIIILIAGGLLTVSSIVETEVFEHHGSIFDAASWVLPPIAFLIIGISGPIFGPSKTAATIGIIVGVVIFLDAIVGHEGEHQRPRGLLALLSRD